MIFTIIDIKLTLCNKAITMEANKISDNMDTLLYINAKVESIKTCSSFVRGSFIYFTPFNEYHSIFVSLYKILVVTYNKHAYFSVF